MASPFAPRPLEPTHATGSELARRAQAKENVGVAFREGNFALAEVKYAAGDIKPMVIESVGTAQVPPLPDAACGACSLCPAASTSTAPPSLAPPSAPLLHQGSRLPT